MAEHADTAEQVTDSTTDASDAEINDVDMGPKRPRRQWWWGRDRFPGGQWYTDPRSAIAFGLVVVAALAGVAGWHGYRAYRGHETEAQRNLYVQVARQTAIDLTSISYSEIDNDFQRIMDSSTGALHESVQTRHQDFALLAKQEQSKMEGKVEEAALESADGDQAKVLVAVSVKISTAAAPEQKPRRYRWRMSVEKTPDGAKVSNFELVP
jgi:Mce-associated membrane protein